jgi:hypothetical protein
MDLNPFTLSLLISGANSVGVAWVAWTQYMRKPGEDAVKGVQGMGDRITLLEAAQKNVATHADLASLRGSIHNVETRLEGMAESSRRTNIQLDRIENFLLNRTK